jgi:hypothetical protein
MKNNNEASKFVKDLSDMHTKFGVNPVINTLDKEKLKTFLKFRLDFLQEELDEARAALESSDVEWVERSKNESRQAAVVDAMIDLVVVAVGTLDAFEVNTDEAWDRVHVKNMQKEPGIKPERPNPLGFPDLIKPAGWTPPTHEDNVGLLVKVFE